MNQEMRRRSDYLALMNREKLPVLCGSFQFKRKGALSTERGMQFEEIIAADPALIPIRGRFIKTYQRSHAISFLSFFQLVAKVEQKLRNGNG